MDAQDAQDHQEGRLLRERLTPAKITCGFQVGLLLHFGKRKLECKRLTRSNTDARDYKPAVSGKNPVHPVHRCESKIYPCLTMNRFPATRRKRLFQASPC